jgi:hypothetical protein
MPDTIDAPEGNPMRRDIKLSNNMHRDIETSITYCYTTNKDLSLLKCLQNYFLIGP